MKKIILGLVVVFVLSGLVFGVFKYNEKSSNNLEKSKDKVSENLEKSKLNEMAKSNIINIVNNDFKYIGVDTFKDGNVSNSEMLLSYFYNVVPKENYFVFDEEYNTDKCPDETYVYFSSSFSVDESEVYEYVMNKFGKAVVFEDVVVNDQVLYKYNSDKKIYEMQGVCGGHVYSESPEYVFGLEKILFVSHVSFINLVVEDNKYIASFYRIKGNIFNATEFDDGVNSEEEIFGDDIDDYYESIVSASEGNDDLNYAEYFIEYCKDNDYKLAKHEFTFEYDDGNFVLRDYKIVK